MKAVILGNVFPIDVDTDDGCASTFRWTGKVPLCPACLPAGRVTPLEDADGCAMIHHAWAGESYVRCDVCGWQNPEILQ